MILPSKFKIKDTKRIDKVKNKGRLFQSEGFGLVALKNDDNTSPRFAFVISTKISKLAVHRNRINRSLNEGIRRMLSKIPKNYDFVFLAKRNISTKNTEEIIREVSGFFEKIDFN